MGRNKRTNGLTEENGEDVRIVSGLKALRVLGGDESWESRYKNTLKLFFIFNDLTRTYTYIIP